MYLTLNQVLGYLRGFGEAHKQINSYRFGDITEHLANGEISYPGMFVDINPTEIKATELVSIFNFSIWFGDLSNVVDRRRENEVEVLSDLTLIAQDFIALLSDFNYQDYWQINSISPLEYFIPGNVDEAILAKFNIGLSVDFTPNPCIVPL